MDALMIPFGLGLAFVLLATPVVAFLGWSTARRLKDEVGLLRQRLAQAERTLDRLRDGAPPEDAPVAEPPPAPPIAASPPSPPARPAPGMAAERVLTERWLVWLGGITLALGGAFLVKYSVEQGWLVPWVRVLLGMAAGVAAIAAGHWLSRRSMGPALPSHVPPVLVGAGAAIVFASVFAAYGLYHLMAAMPAFIALAAVAVATVLLSLGHGPFVAMMGLTGAFVVPLLVRSDAPSAVGLFGYLVVLVGGTLALLRWRDWAWLVWLALAGAALWSLLWLATAFQSGDEAVLGLFLCAVAALFAGYRLGVPVLASLAGPRDGILVRRAVAAAGLVLAGLALAVVIRADFSPAALLLPFALGVGYLAFAARDQVFDALPAAAAAVVVLALAAWDADVSRTGNWVDLLLQPLPGDARRFLTVAVAAAALYGTAGFLLLARVRRPARWAGLSAAAPCLMLAVSYWRLAPLAAGWLWTALALALAGALVAAAGRVGRRLGEGALGAYAVGVVAALALAVTFILEEAWLSVALAVLVAGIAWIEARLPLRGLRQVALVLAGAVLVRLAANPYVLDYSIADARVVNWLLYGYGLPAVAFLAAARLFRRNGDDVLVQVLEAGAVAFGVLLVSLEIRHLMAGGLDAGHGYGLAERALHTIAWLSGALLLFLIHGRTGRLVPLQAGRALLLVASMHALAFQVVGNPLLSGARVGEMAVFNTLLLAYAAPALLYAGLARVVAPPPPWLRPACAGAALLLAFLWATLEVRHAFVGGQLWRGAVGQVELWAYSVVYLLGGLGVLLGGIRLRSAAFRRAGLVVVLVVVAKVFLIDLSQLTGLWRALSFLGLGSALMGVGWLYRLLERD